MLNQVQHDITLIRFQLTSVILLEMSNYGLKLQL